MDVHGAGSRLVDITRERGIGKLWAHLIQHSSNAICADTRMIQVLKSDWVRVRQGSRLLV